MDLLCDGVNHCEDGSDESASTLCASKSIKTFIEPTIIQLFSLDDSETLPRIQKKIIKNPKYKKHMTKFVEKKKKIENFWQCFSKFSTS